MILKIRGMGYKPTHYIGFGRIGEEVRINTRILNEWLCNWTYLTHSSNIVKYENSHNLSAKINKNHSIESI